VILRAGSGRLAEARLRAMLRLQEVFDASPVGAAPADGERTQVPRARWRLDRRAVLALLVVALVGASWAGLVALRSRPHAVDVAPAVVLATGTPPPQPGASPAVSPVASPAASAVLLVDVQGPVRRPGVVHLPAGSRVLDALRAAGGAKRGVSTSSLNLARPLSDGEQVVLAPRAGTAPAGGGAGGAGGVGGAGPASGPVDLNAATLADLDALPGVGPVLAQRILDWRQEHGRFTSVEELQEVPGIGPATYADLRHRVRV
jgi:competence protein ComEA